LNAYTKALDFDREFLMSRLNRATTWLKTREFENCIADCKDIEDHIIGLKESEREDEFYWKMMGRMHVKRGAGYLWTSQFDKAVDDFEKAIGFKGVFSE
jgi:hypothetical protein